MYSALIIILNSIITLLALWKVNLNQTIVDVLLVFIGLVELLALIVFLVKIIKITKDKTKEKSKAKHSHLMTRVVVLLLVGRWLECSCSNWWYLCNSTFVSKFYSGSNFYYRTAALYFSVAGTVLTLTSTWLSYAVKKVDVILDMIQQRKNGQ